MTIRAKVLLAITVYNGRSFVPDAIRSAIRMDTTNHDVDILVLDDHSPDPGWSEELAVLCRELRVRYYCTPRNLGIPRNVNLALLSAHEGTYTHVVVANSDVLFPSNLIESLVGVCSTDDTIASVTAWSNNASIYSLPNDDPVTMLSDQDRVDWLSTTLANRYGRTAVDVPAGISFCIMIPTWAVRTVGLMDPVFGRGYCEETDWSLRSQQLGFRCTVAPGVFVYHAGKGSNESAGLLRAGATTVDEHELIIDMRYPNFRSDVGLFRASGVLARLHAEGLRAICRAAAREYGYSIEVGYLGGSTSGTTPVVTIDPSTPEAPVSVEFLGFRATIEIERRPESDAVGRQIFEFAGGMPTGVNLLDRGPRTQHLLDQLGVEQPAPIYPARV